MSKADRNRNGPRDFCQVCLVADFIFHHDKQHAADQQRHRHWQHIFRQLKAKLVDDQPAGAGDDERNEELGQVVARCRFAAAEGELLHAIGKIEQHREHGAALDGYVENVRLLFQPAELLRQQQVTCGGDREKLSDALDDPEENRCQPFRHAGCLTPTLGQAQGVLLLAAH